MDKKRFFLLLGVFLLLDFASANFVCGEVLGEDVSSAWFDVNIFYSEDPEKMTGCSVSPEGGKYCCDPQGIKGVKWAVGKEVNAEIFDFEKGYLAGPVSLGISGEGFDVFPPMNLRKGVDISISSSVYFSEDVSIDVFSDSYFDGLRYVLRKDGEVLEEAVICDFCNEGKVDLRNLSYGSYEIEVVAFSGEREMSVFEEFSVLEFLELERVIECDQCREGFVRAGSFLNMSVFLRASHGVSGELKDYFPNDWELLDEFGGAVESFSESHDVISYDVSGKDIGRIYSLRAPDGFLARKYVFQSVFEEFFDTEDEIMIYSVYRFLPLSEEFSRKAVSRKSFVKYAEVSESKPLVVNIGNSSGEDEALVQAAFFPSRRKRNVHAFLRSVDGQKDFEKGFRIESSLSDDEIDRILLRFKARKGEDVKLLRYEDGEWEEIEIRRHKEGRNFESYEAYVSQKGVFALKETGKDKKGFFEPIEF